MKVLALVYPGMTLLDLVGPLQAWSFLPGYEVQYAWHLPGPVPTDCGLSVQATNGFENAWSDPDVLFVGGERSPHWTCWAIPSPSLSWRTADRERAGCAVSARARCC